MPSQSFAATVQKAVSLRYALFLPARYEAAQDERFPLILFLHGTGERGDTSEAMARVLSTGLPKKLAAWPDCPFIVIAPQCPTDSIWPFHLDALDALLETVITTHRVDRQRLYLTGLSLGGNATWYMAMAYPGRFAAIAPICGRGTSTSAIARLKEMPVWVFHGGLDSVVPVGESVRMVSKLREVGGNVRFTVYPDADHDSWTAAYEERALYEWFLAHRLGRQIHSGLSKEHPDDPTPMSGSVTAPA